MSKYCQDCRVYIVGILGKDVIYYVIYHGILRYLLEVNTVDREAWISSLS